MRHGRKLSFDETYEEVVADSMEAILADGYVVQLMSDMRAQDKTLWEKVRDWFKDLAQKLQAAVDAFRGVEPDSVEGKLVSEMQDMIVILESFYTDALLDAGENYAARVQKNTAEGGENTAVKRSEIIVDQIRNSLNEIMALDAVYEIDSKNATPFTSDRKTDEKSGNDVFKGQGGIANRPGFGRVVLSKRGAVHTVHHGNGPAKQASFPAIKAVIEQGIEIYRDINHEGRGFDTVTFSAPINFFGSPAPLATVVKVFDGVNADKAFYIHEICDAEGNYMQFPEDGAEQKNSSANFVEPTSTVSTADNGIAPKNSIRNPGEDVKPKMSTRDSAGRQLTEAQQEYFKDSKVRDKDGNLLVMYHGTPNGGLTQFRSGSYFTQNPEYATVYQSPGASSLSVKPGASNPMNYEVYLNITKPFDTRNPKEREIFMKEYYRKYGTGAPLSESGLPDWTDGMDLQEFIEDMGYDYDGLILDEGATGGYGEAVKSRGLSYVTFSSEQVKRVDNLSPTSDPDMRYSGRDTDMSGGTAQKNTADEGGVRCQSKVESYQEPITQFDVDILRLAGKKVLIIFPPKRCKMHKSGCRIYKSLSAKRYKKSSSVRQRCLGSKVSAVRG